MNFFTVGTQWNMCQLFAIKMRITILIFNRFFFQLNYPEEYAIDFEPFIFQIIKKSIG